MASSIVGATLRLSIDLASSRTDLVVPVWLDVDDLTQVVVERLGLEEGASPRLRTAAGRLLEPGRSLEDAGLRHGSVVLVDLADAAGSAGLAAEEDAAPAPRRLRLPSWVLGAAAAALVVGAVVASLSDGGVLRRVTLALLLLAGLVALLPGGDGGVRRQRLHLAPWCLGGAALVAAGAAGGPLLAVAVGGLGAFAAAGAVRALTDDDVVARVWLWGAGMVAATASLLLLAGAGPAGLWATAVALSVVWVRLLPTLVVDVPDDTLLDLDTLAITAWSARDERQGRRRRRTVRRRDVDGLAARGGVLLRTGTSGAVAVWLVAGVLLLRALEGAETWALVGGQVMVGGSAVAVALLARAYRDWRLQLLLRGAAALLGLGVAVSTLADAGAVTTLSVAAATAAVAVGVVWAATALGHGWRSVWWARVADVLQGFCLALTLALLPLASGLFDVVWRFTS